MCGNELDEIVRGKFIWMCRDKDWPHLWEGVPGGMMSSIGDRNALIMAQEIIRLRGMMADEVD